MGFKRPFDDEEFQELPFKQARQLDYSNKLIQFSGSVPYCNSPQKLDILDDNDGNFVNCQWHGRFEKDSTDEVLNLAKDSENSASLSLVTSSSSDDDFGSGAAAYSLFSPEVSEFEFPRKTSMPLEDIHSSCLDDVPRKPIPLGADHQASIPLWGEHIKKDKSGCSFNTNVSSSVSQSDHEVYDDSEGKLTGICIIPMPDAELFLHSSYEAGGGRTDCGCLDEGSSRCVRQHIMEARENLIKFLGHEKFVNLGFCDMGEEVARQWSEEEERVFHAVVYSNPVSLRRNFWKHLAQVFPARNRKEIVSYYYNVFMLRKRSAQNRSNLLDIDSDDDELPRVHRGSYEIRVPEEDEDSDLESPINHYDHAHPGEVPLEDFDDDDHDDSDDDGGDFDDDGDVGDGGGDTTGEDSVIDYVSGALDVDSFIPVDEHMDKKAGSEGVDFAVQDDSCMSFEFQADKVDSRGPVDTGAALQASEVTSDHSKCLPGKVYGCGEDVDPVYLLDPCDAKVWDARYSSPIRGVDLLPTSNIIEEIFGQGSCNDPTRNDNCIS